MHLLFKTSFVDKKFNVCVKCDTLRKEKDAYKDALCKTPKVVSNPFQRLNCERHFS